MSNGMKIERKSGKMEGKMEEKRENQNEMKIERLRGRFFTASLSFGSELFIITF